MARNRTVNKRLTGIRLWSDLNGRTADRDLDLVLGAVTKLPLRYWRERMFFFGASDKDLFHLTEGRFPRKRIPKHTHPIFALEPLPENAGFRVCPCSSKRSFGNHQFRYINKGCRLDYTHHEMDRDSYLLEALRMNIPESVGADLRFKGVVPPTCIRGGDQVGRQGASLSPEKGCCHHKQR